MAHHNVGERSANLSEGTNAQRDSDEPIVPIVSAIKDHVERSAESREGSGLPKRNDVQSNLPRTPRRTQRKSHGLYCVREAFCQDSTLKFTALLRHVNEDCLIEVFFNLKKRAAVEIDGVTWHDK